MPTTHSPSDLLPASPADAAPDAAPGAVDGDYAARASSRGSTARAASAYPADRPLALLLHAAERGARLGLTVVVDGTVVTGTLVGTTAYCRALADQFAAPEGGTTMDEAFAEAFRALMDDADDVARGDRRTPPDATAFARAVPFLHLVGARYVSGPAVLPCGRHGVLWTCRVADVTSWSLGNLTPN